MSIKPFSEIEAEFNLSRCERNWQGKKSKLNKVFWTIVCHYESSSTVDHNYYVYQVFNAFVHLFYRPIEAENWILDKYNNEKISDIKRAVDFESLQKEYIKIGYATSNKVIKIIREIPQSENTVGSVNMLPEIDLKEFDIIRPHLISATECFSLIFDNCFSTIEHGHRPISDLYLDKIYTKKLEGEANIFVRAGIIQKAISQLMRQIDSNCVYKLETKIEVESPTEALRDALLYKPYLLNRTDKQIKYHIKNNYLIKDNEKFTGLQKAIKRQREKENQ